MSKYTITNTVSLVSDWSDRGVKKKDMQHFHAATRLGGRNHTDETTVNGKEHMDHDRVLDFS